MTPPRARLTANERYMLSLWMIRAYLLSEEWEADLHLAWIQSASGLTDEAFEPARCEAQKSAENWRSVGKVDEALSRIERQLSEMSK